MDLSILAAILHKGNNGNASGMIELEAIETNYSVGIITEMEE